jgi:hypothetical protein
MESKEDWPGVGTGLSFLASGVTQRQAARQKETLWMFGFSFESPWPNKDLEV